jgi:amino acid adenylation domain-containing protein
MDLRASLQESLGRHADRPAVWVGGRILSYRAAHLAAARLLKEAVPTGRGLIAIAAERNFAYYAAVLGALSAGIGYVPLNPRWPEQRIRQILDAAAPDALVLDETTAAAQLGQTIIGAGRHPVLTFAPDTNGDAALSWLSRPAAIVPRGFASEELAYIMFTSGSTGAPKGVPITRENTTHYVTALRTIAEFGPEDRFIQTVELTFDLSVHDMLLCWTAGGMLVVVPESSAPLGPRFVRQLDVTSWLSVPSVAAQSKTLKLLAPGSMPSLRTSFFCGEALPRSLADTWLDAAPNSRVLNIYGPTEATIAFSAYELHRRSVPDLPVIPLGWPMGGQAMHVDATGELLLSGPQLSPGYLMDSERTARAFFEAEGHRWYRTGDLAEVSPDHGFLFRGRLDSQVKLRGYRVELGEVEAALRKAAGTDLVAAVPYDEAGTGSWRALAAFLCGSHASEKELRLSLRALLPDYMMPNTLRFLDAMPKNVNDKLDYLALRRMADANE